MYDIVYILYLIYDIVYIMYYIFLIYIYIYVWDPELLKNQPRMGRQSSQMAANIKKNGAGGTPKEEQNTKMKKRGGVSNSAAVF